MSPSLHRVGHLARSVLATVGALALVGLLLALALAGRRSRGLEDLVDRLETSAERARRRAGDLAEQRERAARDAATRRETERQARRDAEAAEAARLLADDAERGRRVDDILRGD